MTRKPIRKFLPLTYQPKIPGVMDGSITQSIRIDTQLSVGDYIAFHGWEGRPYHSPWSFRTEYYRVRLAKPINIHADFVYLPEEKRQLKIGDPILDRLAEKDGIEPATGEELLKVLHGMHGDGTLYGKVLRWEPIKAEPVTVMVTPEQQIAAVHSVVSVSSIMPFDFEPKRINKPLFDKVRQIEKDLKQCSDCRDIPAISQ
jgi:hypothetical protein